MSSDYKKRIGVIRAQEITYLGGLLDIIGYLCIELADFLYEEDKYDRSPIRVINAEFADIWDKDLENISNFNKILYLFRPRLVYEFKRLKKRKLTSSEASIVIIRKLLQIISEKPHSNPYPIDKFNIIFTQVKILYSEILTKSKKDSLFGFCCMLRDCINEGYLGKYEIDDIKLCEIELEKTEFIGERDIISQEKVITEIEWND